MEINTNFWQGKKIFLTGHTGFKGSWLSLWLGILGADVTGYALTPPTKPNFFELCKIEKKITSIYGDVRDGEHLRKAMVQVKPDIVIHLAAQPLVRDSYKIPVETYAVNIMGIVNLLEAIRFCNSVRAVINVTTDKCYDNMEWVWGYRENDRLGGVDPYSSSKACSEFITTAYRNSFFNPEKYETHGVALASARAGNVIGGGDWAADRLIPDCIRAFEKQEQIIIRSPEAIRPWQHVLEPLSGYLLLAQKLYEEGPSFGEAWNFGPLGTDDKQVEWIVKTMCEKWKHKAYYRVERNDQHVHEAFYLKLDCSKAHMKLGWKPRWNLATALEKIYEWHQDHFKGYDMAVLSYRQIEEYMNTCYMDGR